MISPDSQFLLTFVIAILALVFNIVQFMSYRRVKNKISIWAKDAKSMANSIVEMQDNIKNKKITTLADASSNLDTMGNFANSMYTSMEEEMGHTKRDITS